MAYLIMSIYRYYDIRKYIKIKLEFKAITKYFLEFFILLIPYYYNKSILALLVLLLICLMYIRRNSNIINLILDKVRKKIMEVK